MQDVFLFEIGGNLAEQEDVFRTRILIKFVVEDKGAKKVLLDIKKVGIMRIAFLRELELIEIWLNSLGVRIALVDNFSGHYPYSKAKIPVFQEREQALVSLS